MLINKASREDEPGAACGPFGAANRAACDALV